MQRVIPKFRLLTYQQSPETGTEVVTLILEHRGNNYHLEGATKDIIHVFTAGAAIYVLNINKAHSTIRLYAYMTPEPDPINSIFLQTHREITDALGKKWEQLSPETITRRLINNLI